MDGESTSSINLHFITHFRSCCNGRLRLCTQGNKKNKGSQPTWQIFSWRYRSLQQSAEDDPITLAISTNSITTLGESFEYAVTLDPRIEVHGLFCYIWAIKIRLLTFHERNIAVCIISAFIHAESPLHPW